MAVDEHFFDVVCEVVVYCPVKEILKKVNKHYKETIEGIRKRDSDTLKKYKRCKKTYFELEKFILKHNIQKESSLWLTSGSIILNQNSEESKEDYYKRVWDLVSLIQDTFVLEDGDIRKMFNSYRSLPIWYWEIKFPTDYILSVYKSEPDPDCTPVQMSYTSTSWVCEK